MLPVGAQDTSPDAIYAALCALGLGGSVPVVDRGFQGGESRIFKVSFKDHQSLSVRVRHPSEGNQQDIIDTVEMEARTFRTLEAKNFPWSPRYRGASLSFDNPIQYPFLVFDWVEGYPLKWDDNFPPPTVRDTILGQLCEVQLSLVLCTLEDRSTTATEFYEQRIKRQTHRAMNGKLPGITEKDCLDQLALLPKILGENGSCSLFAMDHVGLKPSNIIVDDENNIKCVIDWPFAAMVPLIQAAKLPCFLWTDESAACVPSEIMLRDRKAYVDSSPVTTSQPALLVKGWQSAKDVDFRTLYLESTF